MFFSLVDLKDNATITLHIHTHVFILHICTHTLIVLLDSNTGPKSVYNDKSYIHCGDIFLELTS